MAATARDLLSAWEKGRSSPPHLQALLLLQLASPQSAREELARLSIGRRDALLLDLRERLFGPVVASAAACPSCGEELEFDFEVGAIRLDRPAEGEGPLLAELGALQVAFRLPDSDDLCAVAAAAGREAERDVLLKRCVTEIRLHGEPVAELPEEAVSPLMETMARADPQADITLALDCPSCAHRWLAPFDIASFLSSEIEAWAERVTYEVHALATAYGWSEGETLAVSALRRQRYLELIGA